MLLIDLNTNGGPLIGCATMAESDAAVPSRTASLGPGGLSASGILLIIGALYFGREFFIPFTLAILLAFALSPIVNLMRHWRVPRVLSVAVTVTFAFLLIGALGWVMVTQTIRLAEDLPSYQQTMIEKIRSIRGSASGGGVVERVSNTLQGLSRELNKEAPVAAGPAVPPVEAEAEARPPVPVTVVDAASSPLQVLATMAAPIVAPLTTTGIVIVFVVFVLLRREDLRDRFLKLAGAGDLRTSTQALNEAAARVSRYLLMQLIVNVSYGVPIGIGLYLIGVPNAALWGLLAVVLRFIPFLGPVLAAMFPVALAFAVDPGWSMLLWVVGLFVAVELFSNNVVEPWLYGASTGLSSLAIIASAIFWTLLWGPIGLVLATPLTVCLVVIGRYVPRLEFLDVLLGSDPVLAPDEKIYQRLLAGNVEEAVETAEDFVDEHSLAEFLEQVALPALRRAELDASRGGESAQRSVVGGSMVTVIQEAAEHALGNAPRGGGSRAGPVEPPRLVQLSIGGRTALDAAAAELVACASIERGIGTRVLGPFAISQAGIGQLDLAGIEVVCLSYLSAQPQTYARFVCRRLKRRAPEIRILVCLWGSAAEAAGDLAANVGADAVATTVEQTMGQLEAWGLVTKDPTMTPAPIPANEAARLDALRELGLTTGQGRLFDDVAAHVAAAFKTAIALVSVIDETHQIWPGAAGLGPRLDACRMDARETSICGHVVASNEALVVKDVANDPRFAGNPFLIENGIRAYIGVPLRTSSGFAIGSLCAIDTQPRDFDDADVEVLRSIAVGLMSEIEARAGELAARGEAGPLLGVVDGPPFTAATAEGSRGPAA